MSQIPTPPPSRGASTEPAPLSSNKKYDTATTTTLDEKIQLLDKLLENYLDLLDSHQKLQESLGKQLSSGFFQLAHANFCSPRRRFGEDFYDERMKATRRLKIVSSLKKEEERLEPSQTNNRLSGVRFEVEYKSVLDSEDQEADAETKDEEGAKSKENLVPKKPADSSENLDSQDVDDKDADAKENSKPAPRKLFRSDDPISWYGILVPPSLKGAQKSFTEAVNGDIPQLVTVMREMRCIEDRIYELKREINIDI